MVMTIRGRTANGPRRCDGRLGTAAAAGGGGSWWFGEEMVPKSSSNRHVDGWYGGGVVWIEEM
eukprot:6998875-Prymnesium_polylepis.1